MDIIDGYFINVGDTNLYVKILGNGNPPIIVEPAIGGLSVEWYLLQKELAKYTTVVTYDRAGYGESNPAKTPRVTKNLANELFNLLFTSDLEHPYILIGHLEGGLIVQHFANLFPFYTAGLVLLDSPFPNFFQLESKNFPLYFSLASYNTRLKNLKKLIEINDSEFQPKIIPLLEEIYKDFPEDYKIPLITYQSDKKFYETVISEIESLEKSLNEVFDGDNFPDIPVSVVSHSNTVMQELSIQLGILEDEAKAIENFWAEGQRRLLSLYPRSSLYIVENSDRNFQYSNPSAIIEVVVEILEIIRNEN